MDDPRKGVAVRIARQALRDLELFSDIDRRDFANELERVRESPITRSMVLAGENDDDRPARYFEFGVGVVKVAIIELDFVSSTIWVIRCRLGKPRRMR